MPKRVSFNNDVKVQYVEAYKKYNSGVSFSFNQNRPGFIERNILQMSKKYVNLSYNEQMKICRQVNMYKMKEMEVHSSSVRNIHVLSFLPKVK